METETTKGQQLSAQRPIDTTNKFLVAVHGDDVVIVNPRRRMDKDDALNLAAWLVALAGGLPPVIEGEQTKARFDAVYEAVCNT